MDFNIQRGFWFSQFSRQKREDGENLRPYLGPRQTLTVSRSKTEVFTRSSLRASLSLIMTCPKSKRGVMSGVSEEAKAGHSHFIIPAANIWAQGRLYRHE
jgi:hypothetical protein